LDLWNFGGFDVDALTDDKKPDARKESRLSSAFGQLDLGRGRYGGAPQQMEEYGDYYGRRSYEPRQQWQGGGQGSYGMYQYGGGGGE
jgi:hypothetical protein